MATSSARYVVPLTDGPRCAFRIQVGYVYHAQDLEKILGSWDRPCAKTEQRHGKRRRGAIELTENSNAFRGRIISGSKITRLGHEFEAVIKPESGGNHEILKHHGEQRSNKSTLFKDIRLHSATIEESGKPFLEEIQDLLVLDTKDIAG